MNPFQKNDRMIPKFTGKIIHPLTYAHWFIYKYTCVTPSRLLSSLQAKPTRAASNREDPSDPSNGWSSLRATATSCWGATRPSPRVQRSHSSSCRKTTTCSQITPRTGRLRQRSSQSWDWKLMNVELTWICLTQRHDPAVGWSAWWIRWRREGSDPPACRQHHSALRHPDLPLRRRSRD